MTNSGVGCSDANFWGIKILRGVDAWYPLGIGNIWVCVSRLLIATPRQ